jgi:D-glycero-alpha-D-manno-heptose-7-phosphate kinase
MKVKKVRAPVRVDFGGGTTDIAPFYSKYGGAVLNCAIQKYVVGEIVRGDKKVGLGYEGDVPTSSGLGTSGAMTLVWLALITKEKDKAKLCEWVYNISQARELFDDGKQDQYAAAFGGINFMEFDKKGKVKMERLNLKKKVLKGLEKHMVLVYTGKPHYSGYTNSAVFRDMRKGKNVKNLLAIKRVAYDMKAALLKGDLDEFAELMNVETANRKMLASGIVGPRLKKLIHLGMDNGAIGAKVCGSGGGGSVLFFGDKRRLKKKFGKSVIEFKVDFGGLRWGK